MNKIFNINLGGYPFTIDDDAFRKLDKYLNTIKKHFSDSHGCEDIISDIEVRIAELFNQELKGAPIVSMREVDRVIEIMGRPEAFGADCDLDEHEPIANEHKKKSTRQHSHESWNDAIKTGKRLFRDPDDQVIGGVCSGVAAYFGISDPVWVRLAFILAFIGGGFGVIIYLVMWAAVPKARTSGDKLAMKGERINVSNIAKKVEEELNSLSDSITELTKDFQSKKKR